MSYKLSATLSGHTQDVRCVASSSSGSRILSSSRDRTARSWVHRNDSGWTAAATYAGAHENFVNAVAALQLRDGREMVVTGSGDATILLWPLDGSQPEPEKVLVGHAGNVCALNTSSNNDNDALKGMLASGSWDGTAKIWDLSDPSSPTSSEPVYTLEGATQAVWAVLLLPTSTRGSIHCLTASADKLIRLYHNASHVATFKGHEQPVRALSLVPPAAVGEQGIFASAGNDGLVKIWNWTQGSASELRTLQGHDSFVYSLATALDGTLASSGEDRTVRVWDKLTGDLKQIITIPAISIWSVAFVAGTDDIIVGSSDSLVRVFTRDPARFAPADELAALDEAVSSSTLNASQVVGDVKKSDLASDDTLAARQGKKEGEIAMVKNAAGGVEAYQWSAADGKWVKVGQVVDAVGSGRKQLYEGKEYDFVFDVDVSEGQPPLKLPYNVTQNPYEAAQLFLTRNELPPSYVDQVVQFIEKNTAGATLGSGGNLDPYTGASSYKSTPSTNAPKPQGQNGTMGNGFSGDPWGPSSAGAGANAAPAKARLLPLTTPLTFPQANLAAIQKKLLDFNEALSENPTTSTEFPLDASSMTTLESSIASLQAASSSSPFSASAELLAILGRLLEWPSASRFPALDLVRIVALHDSTGAAAASLLFPLLANLSPDPAAAQKENETNALLATRAIANAFSGAGGRKAMGHAAAEALETLSVVGTAGLNKLGKTALATVALNFSILAVQGSVPSDSIGSLVELIQQLLQDTESETVYRALVAFGNVAHASRINKQSLDASTAKNVKQHAQALAAGTGEQRIKEIVREIEQKL